MNKIHILGKKVGLNKKDIDSVLSNSNRILEQVNYSYGPHWYPGGRYGTISIKDFY